MEAGLEGREDLERDLGAGGLEGQRLRRSLAIAFFNSDTDGLESCVSTSSIFSPLTFHHFRSTINFSKLKSNLRETNHAKKISNKVFKIVLRIQALEYCVAFGMG